MLTSKRKFFSLIYFFLFLIISPLAVYSEPFRILYHGSPSEFDQVEPRYSKRIDANGEILWEGEAIFATSDMRIALYYTQAKARVPGYSSGIGATSLSEKDPIIYHVKGGNSKEEALKVLWEDEELSQGWIYLLDGRYFVKEPGLSDVEWISRDIEANIDKVKINPRQEIQEFVDKGQIVINWKP